MGILWGEKKLLTKRYTVKDFHLFFCLQKTTTSGKVVAIEFYQDQTYILNDTFKTLEKNPSCELQSQSDNQYAQFGLNYV
jgi:hypothetical protein